MMSASKPSAIDLVQQIEDAHDMWPSQGKQWEACGVQGFDKCRICGLTHFWYRHGQNSGDLDRWTDAKGNEITLAEAARMTCG